MMIDIPAIRAAARARLHGAGKTATPAKAAHPANPDKPVTVQKDATPSLVQPVSRLAALAAPSDETQDLPRPYRLSREQADRAHLLPWSEAVIHLFLRRQDRLQRLGLGEGDAEDLAERLHLRDVDLDDRSVCVECGHARDLSRCSASAGTPAATAQLHRCGAFVPALDA